MACGSADDDEQCVPAFPTYLAGSCKAASFGRDFLLCVPLPVLRMHFFMMQKMMADNADAFIALPGGYGTLEELLEVITWQQLGFHNKPIGVLNINGFFDHLISFVDHLVAEVSLV